MPFGAGGSILLNELAAVTTARPFQHKRPSLARAMLFFYPVAVRVDAAINAGIVARAVELIPADMKWITQKTWYNEG